MNSSVEKAAVEELEELKRSRAPGSAATPNERRVAFGCAREFFEHRFVYTVISHRAGGLSVGVNLNPDQHCNFDCVYCEVNRAVPARERQLEVEAMAAELEQLLADVHSGRLQQQPCYAALPGELLELKHVALSGDGEPTLCPNFVEAVQAVVHLRALGTMPFFKIVLITNATGLDLPAVQQGLSCLTRQDEIWAKLDAGTQAYMNFVNHPSVSLDKVLSNILGLGRQRPVVIQSLFARIQGQDPPAQEIVEYARRLLELSSAGAQISLVQIYSATRPTRHVECEHLSLQSLSRIARVVRELTGLRAEVF